MWTIVMIESRQYILRSKLTWSFLLLAVWSFFATLPILFSSSFWILVWTSSHFQSNLNFHFSISFNIPSSPLTNFDISDFVIILHLSSIFAWAILPRTSYCASLWSYWILLVKISTNGFVFFLNLPPHSFSIRILLIIKRYLTGGTPVLPEC